MPRHDLIFGLEGVQLHGKEQDEKYGFVHRLDLSAAGEVSELMDNATYETYLKECEEH